VILIFINVIIVAQLEYEPIFVGSCDDRIALGDNGLRLFGFGNHRNLCLGYRVTVCGLSGLERIYN
jgi:hypothetical protein